MSKSERNEKTNLTVLVNLLVNFRVSGIRIRYPYPYPIRYPYPLKYPYPMDTDTGHRIQDTSS